MTAATGGRLEPGGIGARLRAHTGTVVFVLGAIAAVAAVVSTLARGVVQPQYALVFAGVIAVGEMARVTLPGNRETAPLGAAGALAYALLPDVHGTVSRHGVLQVVAVVGVALLAGTLPHVARGRAPAPAYVARRLLAAGFAATLFRPLYVTGVLDPVMERGWAYGTFLVLVVLLTSLCDAVVAAMARVGRPFCSALLGELRDLCAGLSPTERIGPEGSATGRAGGGLTGVGTAVGATGMLIALSTSALGLWAVPVFCLPSLLVMLSFRRYAAIRLVHLQTVDALSRLPEAAGCGSPGHAARVGELAHAVGVDLGLGGVELRELEYAAKMHDIGQLALVEPVPGGTTLDLPAAEQRRIARLGADVIRESGLLDRVATIVAAQADPYRDDPAGPPPPLASRIIKVVNAYDDLVAPAEDPRARHEVFGRLRADAAGAYDPRVVEALAQVVERTG
ncbi:HD-GYP domain-containing protein [Embleya sp. NBC_00896]|uniref:HD-GYP domain-containing protein n=1 Tax=Embleya sp. NBC_00896 TaxID=2975961 RepID=UPI003863687F|nr:metal-dependent phosphohydrolase [Embleya sp. NBC_00896]